MLGDRERLAPEPVPPAPTSGPGGPALRTTDRLVPLAAVVPPAKVEPLPVTRSLVKSSGSAGAGALAMTWPAWPKLLALCVPELFPLLEGTAAAPRWAPLPCVSLSQGLFKRSRGAAVTSASQLASIGQQIATR
jgi:hypothetical protein